MNITPIAFASTPFKEKFGIPRQPSLIKHANSVIEFVSPYDQPDAFVGLEEYSHLWLQFGFHQHEHAEFKPLVRPPRLGGNKKTGVFATRSSFRPNSLGLSLVELKQVILDKKTSLIVSCPDLLDGTPIYDIKPYIEYSDSAINPQCSIAKNAPSSKLDVVFSDKARAMLHALTKNSHTNLECFVKEVMEQDPRPAYKQQNEDPKIYGMKLYEFEIKFRVEQESLIVIDIAS
ncbi:MAG: tRNA (N6-threonylcarbamoyladenosine(37)-N6)-methyltransferase TrmO [Oleiphilaceae bacterium]|nr:tRNA (N6-threonylcarbamoyladenosine(37)-N6)-methyltransferase TrmO [Oleiphilaceae bacterium]